MAEPAGREEVFRRFLERLPRAYRDNVHFIPIVENGKEPDVPAGTSTKSVRLTPEQALERIRAGKNVGIMFHVDKDGIFVVDIDHDELTDEEVEELRAAFPHTFTVRTPHGGYHLYYIAVNRDHITNAIYFWNEKRAGEIRARNYYVLCPGSVVDGKMYTIADDAPIHAVLLDEFPPIVLKQRRATRIEAVDPRNIRAEGFDPKKYRVPDTVWTLQDVLEFDKLLATLLSIPPDAEPPFQVFDKEYPSQSEVDAAILCLLAQYGVPEEDAYRILKAYRYRPKLDRSDYLPRTWARVAQDVFRKKWEIYDPDAPLISVEKGIELAKKVHQLAASRRPAPLSVDVPMWESVLQHFPRDHFVRRYVDIARKMTGAYPEYHIAAALFALSAACGKRVRFRGQDPRLFVMLIGYPAISHKSTAITGIMYLRLLKFAPLLEDIHAPVEFSSEGFIQELHEKGELYVIYDEISHLFKLMSRQYAAAIEEYLLTAFETGKPLSRRLKKEIIKVDDPWVAIIGATTPSNFEAFFTEERVRSGLFSRFLFVAPEYPREDLPLPNFAPDLVNQMKDLASWLDRMRGALLDIWDALDGSPLLVDFAPDGSVDLLAQWRARHLDQVSSMRCSDDLKENMMSVISRYQDYLIRLSILVRMGRAETLEQLENIRDTLRRRGAGDTVTVAEWIAEPRIIVTREDVEIALVLMDRLFYRYAMRLLEIALSSTDVAVERVYRLLLRMGGCAKYSELLRRSHLTADEFARVLTTLNERKDIVISGRGRARYIYTMDAWMSLTRDESDGEGDSDGDRDSS